MTIRKIVGLFCEPTQANSLQNDLHVKPFIHRKSHELSGGERRMIEILLILNSRAEYVLIDEPFNGVEPIYKDEIKRSIQEHSPYKGFIVTDHDYRNIMAIATKILLLKAVVLKKLKRRTN